MALGCQEVYRTTSNWNVTCRGSREVPRCRWTVPSQIWTFNPPRRECTIKYIAAIVSLQSVSLFHGRTSNALCSQGISSHWHQIKGISRLSHGNAPQRCSCLSGQSYGGNLIAEGNSHMASLTISARSDHNVQPITCMLNQRNFKFRILDIKSLEAVVLWTIYNDSL